MILSNHETTYWRSGKEKEPQKDLKGSDFGANQFDFDNHSDSMNSLDEHESSRIAEKRQRETENQRETRLRVQQLRNYNHFAFRYNSADDYSLSPDVLIDTMTEPASYFCCQMVSINSYKFISSMIAMMNHTDIERSAVFQLQQLLHEKNKLVYLFKTAIDTMPPDTHKIGIYAEKTAAGEHMRRFNTPVIDEVAIVIVEEQFQPIDIVLHDQLT
ncbi:unnamed protein product [Onchocerca ochengi]|uniref:Phosducin domain-containing protein n=1 Tax=Onchocerca ochengi TaxID=42157 RepID=A0A182DWR5_ONCOC|nr:unnamed protein product [Onchocerca ochengi]